MYVLINSGFVTVWSIENESRDYELQGKDFAKNLVSSINIYHASFSTFCQLTTQCMLFSSAQVWTSQCTILMSFNDMYNLYSSLDGSRLCTCGGDGIIRLLDLHTKCEIMLRKTQDNFR